MAKRKSTPKTAPKEAEKTEFYEVMPYATGFTYQDNLAEPQPMDDDDSRQASAAKMTAIVTLVVVAIVVAALAFLVVRGYQAINDTANPITASTSF